MLIWRQTLQHVIKAFAWSRTHHLFHFIPWFEIQSHCVVVQGIAIYSSLLSRRSLLLQILWAITTLPRLCESIMCQVIWPYWDSHIRLKILSWLCSWLWHKLHGDKRNSPPSCDASKPMKWAFLYQINSKVWAVRGPLDKKKNWIFTEDGDKKLSVFEQA